MPKIYLKPNSAEFADENENVATRFCEMPECSHTGDYKAPKDRDLSGYYHFCLEHVQEYNKAWNYFEGMSSSDIEDYIIRSALGERPTWRFDSFAGLQEELRRKAWDFYGEHVDTGSKDKKDEQEKFRHQINKDTPEFEAMAIMGLEPPLDLPGIKTRYKKLVKKYHPDINPGDKGAEDLLKSINMAYTILKLSYEKYENLQDKQT